MSRAEEILFERFPKIGLITCSSHPKEIADEPVGKVDFGKAELLYFYGLGSGCAYSACREWLHENKERKLIFLEDDPGIIADWDKVIRKNAISVAPARKNNPQNIYKIRTIISRTTSNFLR